MMASGERTRERAPSRSTGGEQPLAQPVWTLVEKAAKKGAYRDVLVPVDFSAESVAAVKAAMSVAPDATITLLHAYEVAFEGLLRRADVSPATVEDLRLAAHSDALVRLYEIAKRHSWPARRFRSVVVPGPAAPAILNEALESGTDLIAIGSRRRGVLERLLSASVTRQVLAQAHSDVLIARWPPKTSTF